MLSLDEFGKICKDVEDNDLELVIESKQQKKSLTCFEISNPQQNDQAVIEESFGREIMWFD